MCFMVRQTPSFLNVEIIFKKTLKSLKLDGKLQKLLNCSYCSVQSALPWLRAGYTVVSTLRKLLKNFQKQNFRHGKSMNIFQCLHSCHLMPISGRYSGILQLLVWLLHSPGWAPYAREARRRVAKTKRKMCGAPGNPAMVSVSQQEISEKKQRREFEVFKFHLRMFRFGCAIGKPWCQKNPALLEKAVKVCSIQNSSQTKLPVCYSRLSSWTLSKHHNFEWCLHCVPSFFELLWLSGMYGLCHIIPFCRKKRWCL